MTSGKRLISRDEIELLKTFPVKIFKRIKESETHPRFGKIFVYITGAIAEVEYLYSMYGLTP